MTLVANEDRNLGTLRLAPSPPVPPTVLLRASALSTWTGLGLGGFPTSTSTVVIPSTHPGLLWDVATLSLKKLTCHTIFQMDDTQAVGLDMYGNFVMHHGQFNWISNFAGYIEFHVASEAQFIGGAFTGDPPDTETGLFFLNCPHTIQGLRVEPWALATAGVLVGATSLTLDRDPTGWAIGDILELAPTLPPWDANWLTYDTLTISGIAGRVISFTSTPCTVAHPALIIEGTTIETPEVIHKGRKIEIRGTDNSHRSHVMVMAHDATSALFMSVKNLNLRWMGPRRINSDGAEGGILGRYAWHLHEMGLFSAGALFDGVLAKDCGNHCFVPHASHQVTYQDCVAHNITGEAPFWHDRVPVGLQSPTYLTNPNTTHDTLRVRCFASKVASTQGMATYHRLSGFELNNGLRQRNLSCRAIAVTGGRSTAAVHWTEGESDSLGGGVHEVADFVGHNCTNGGSTWQNTTNPHEIFTGRSRLYHNEKSGYEHGAYTNSYKVGPAAVFAAPIDALILYGNGDTGLTLFANSKPAPQMVGLRNAYVDGVAGQSDYLILEGDHFADPPVPTLFVGNTFRNAGVAVAKIGPTVAGAATPIAWDFTSNDFGGLVPCKFDQTLAIATSVIRVQGPGFATPRRYMKATTPGVPNAGDDFYDAPSNASVKNIAAF